MTGNVVLNFNGLEFDVSNPAGPPGASVPTTLPPAPPLLVDRGDCRARSPVDPLTGLCRLPGRVLVRKPSSQITAKADRYAIVHANPRALAAFLAVSASDIAQTGTTAPVSVLLTSSTLTAAGSADIAPSGTGRIATPAGIVVITNTDKETAPTVSFSLSAHSPNTAAGAARETMHAAELSGGYSGEVAIACFSQFQATVGGVLASYVTGMQARTNAEGGGEADVMRGTVATIPTNCSFYWKPAQAADTDTLIVSQWLNQVAAACELYSLGVTNPTIERHVRSLDGVGSAVVPYISESGFLCWS